MLHPGRPHVDDRKAEQGERQRLMAERELDRNEGKQRRNAERDLEQRDGRKRRQRGSRAAEPGAARSAAIA